MLDDSNVDTERLWMTKMRMMTDGYIQTHHQYSVICPACIERVNSGILPSVERVVGRRLVILGDGGHEILPARAEIHQPGQ